MVYAQEHILLRFNGHFGTTGGVADRWSVGVRLGQASLPTIYDAAKLQTLATAADAAARVFHAAAGTKAGTSCFFDQVAAACIGPSGRYVPPGALTILGPTGSSPGTGTPVLPWNSAMTLSLRTAISRGRGSNGRIYWPALAMPIVATTGRVLTADVVARMGAAKTFLDALNTAANSYFAGTRVIVASNVGAGINAAVTAVRSDDRIDSIERRENDQPPVYSSAALA